RSDARAASFELRLIKAPGELLGRTYRVAEDIVEGASITIGRAMDAQISVHSQAVSRRHAVLVLSPAHRCTLTDVGSRSGITVNGQAADSADLIDGDEIGFGPEVTAIFQQPAGTEKSSAQPLSPAGERVVTTVRRSAWNDAIVVVGISGR